MSQNPIFAVPGLTHNQSSRTGNTSRKRKRHSQTTELRDEQETAETATYADGPRKQELEYTAVLTPTERLQRRLAGHPLDTVPPKFPFPHAPKKSSERRRFSRSANTQSDTRISTFTQTSSLRSQHLATITSVLHRCLRDRDYVRAGRAFGLLIRSEINGRQIDSRDKGLWGIGAEILLNQGSLNDGSMVTRESFERVKAFYDNLALHYPPNKVWPDAVNAQDFKLALFGVWIFVTVQESFDMQNREEETYESAAGAGLQAKSWELYQAEQIAAQMDNLMSTIPYSDNPELIRLRGMVALWCADLVEECEGPPAPTDIFSNEQQESTAFTQQVGYDSNSTNSFQPRRAKGQNARAFAKAMFAKLETGTDQENDYLEGEA